MPPHTPPAPPPPLTLAATASGQGPHLVVLHGLFGAGQNWHTIARQRLGESLTLHLLDLRNHGQSPHSDAHDYPTLAADVAHYIATHVPNGRAHVLGHSMGGKVAMTLALTDPARVDHLIVLDMAPRAYAETHRDLIAAMRAVDLTTARSRKDVEDQLLAAIPDRSVRLFLLTNLARDPAHGDRLRWRVNLDAIERNYAHILGPISGPWPFDGPTRFIRGERSDYLRDEDWPAIQALFPAADLVTIPGAGHWVHADAPAEVSAAVLSHLR